MSGEWKPGDVGVAQTDERFIVTSKGQCFWPGDGGRAPYEGISGKPAASDRPLVVIDPEDAEQVERLLSIYNRGSHDFQEPEWVTAMQAALREFANPTPPKPEEPTGLGAVIEDADGKRWVRVDASLAYAWRPQGNGTDYGDTRYWSRVNAIRVLSPGVEVQS